MKEGWKRRRGWRRKLEKGEKREVMRIGKNEMMREWEELERKREE